VASVQSRRERLRHLSDAIVSRWFVVLQVGALSLAVLTLLWVGNRAFSGWRQSATLLAERRADENVMLLGVALERDMKAMQASVLGRFGERRLGFRGPYDLFDIIASAFSQYSYADSFFVWRAEPSSADGHLYAYSRVDRPPSWAAGLSTASPFPVAVVIDPGALTPMVDAIRHSSTREQFLLTEFVDGSARYQVVASLFYDRGPAQPVVGAVGFLAELSWVRRHYFGEFVRQVDSVIGEDGISFSILDDQSRPVAQSGKTIDGGITLDRHFPLAFFDRSLLAAQSQLMAIPSWTLRVTTTVNADAAARPWGTLWWLMSIVAAAALVSVLLITHAVRAIADHAAVRNEFVATVTHDLKTPLALVKAVGETLEFGRYTGDHRIDEYGRLLRLEATRLALRIDNLLAFARASESHGLSRADPVDLLDVLHESLHRAEPRLTGFEVDANLADAPMVVGDHMALLQVFDNLIDNAIKYSTDTKSISIKTTTEGDRAIVSIQDRGVGIEQADLRRVFEKFFRGRNGRAGSGLGLAIAQRVVRMHAGTIEVASAVGEGTTVTVRLPVSHPA
jgi:signal transduction histidine kinase